MPQDIFARLPDEIITEIFGYLSLADRKRTKLVCKRFKKINETLPLLKKDVFVVKDCTQLNKRILFDGVSNVRISLVGYTYDKKHNKQFWKKYGKQIQSLSLYYERNQQLLMLSDISKLCPNLKKITIVTEEYCSPFLHENFVINASNILSLEMIGNVNFMQFQYILKAAVKVKALNVTRTDDEFNVEDLLEFLRRQGHSLKEFGLSVPLTSEEMQEIFKLCAGQSLKSLTFRPNLGCTRSDIKLDLVVPFIREMPNLEELHLEIVESNFQTLEIKPWLTELFDKLTNLTHVNLNSDLINNECASVLGSLPVLKSLTLVGKNLTEFEFANLFPGNSTYPKLRYLCLKNFNNLTDTVLSGILPQLPNLNTLCLNKCDAFLGGYLKDINKNLKCLKVCFENCIDYCKLTASLNALAGLTYLEINANYLHMTSILPSLKLKHLKSLVLRKVRINGYSKDQIDTFSGAVFLNCPMLEYIATAAVYDKRRSRYSSRGVLKFCDLKLYKEVTILDKEGCVTQGKLWGTPKFCISKH